MSLMIRRAPTSVYMDEAPQADMELIDSCLHCNQCSSRCRTDWTRPLFFRKTWMTTASNCRKAAPTDQDEV